MLESGQASAEAVVAAAEFKARVMETYLGAGALCPVRAAREAAQLFAEVAPPWFHAAVSSKLEPLVSGLRDLEEDMRTVKDDLCTMKDDLHTMKDDLRTMNDDLRTVKDDLPVMQDNLPAVDRVTHNLSARVIQLEASQDRVSSSAFSRRFRSERRG